jgi:hypothetical protein
MSRLRRAIIDALISAAALTTLLLTLIVFDPRVRQQLSMRFAGARPSADLMDAGIRARNLAMVIVEVARDQGLGHAPLMVFVVASVVLVLFMLRV